MIMGYYPLITETKVTHYCGCIYPYGFMKPTETIFFNNEDVEDFIYEGYSSDVCDEFKKQLINQLESEDSKFEVVTIDKEHSVTFYRENSNSTQN